MRTTYWRLVQLVTAVLIAVCLGIHMVVMHLNDILRFFGTETTEPTAWAPMISRASQGIWVSLYIVLLAVGLYHGIYGLRDIILESSPSAKTERIVTWVLIVFGIVFFVGGAYVPVALLSS